MLFEQSVVRQQQIQVVVIIQEHLEINHPIICQLVFLLENPIKIVKRFYEFLNDFLLKLPLCLHLRVLGCVVLAFEMVQ